MGGRGREHVESLSVMSRRLTKALVIISFQIVLNILLGGGLPCEIAAMLVALLKGGNLAGFICLRWGVQDKVPSDCSCQGIFWVACKK